MDEVRDGVWHWTAEHPGWKPGEEWGRVVSSFAIDDGRRLLLIDPLDVPLEMGKLASSRAASIVLTCPWHHRDAGQWGPAHGVPILMPPLDEGDTKEPAGTTYRAGDVLEVGVEAYEGVEPNDLVLWVPDARVLVVGDTLIDQGSGLDIWIQDWNVGTSTEAVRDRLLPLLELPFELVLATHGGPFGREEFERALTPASRG